MAEPIVPHRRGREVATAEDDLLRQTRRDLTARLRARWEELCDAVFTRAHEVEPAELGDDGPGLATGLRETIEACVEAGLTSIEHGPGWTTPIPLVVTQQARRNALAGVELDAVLRRCVAGYTLGWNFVIAEIARQEYSEQHRFALLQEISQVAGSLLAQVQSEIAAAHSAQIRRHAGSRVQRQADVARKLLARRALSADELDELGYELGAWHLAIIVAGPGAGLSTRGLNERLDCQSLVVGHGEQTAWVWLGASRRGAFAKLKGFLTGRGAFRDLSFVTGEPGWGVEGWRQTHREAQSALLVARCCPSRFTRYLDIAPEATALCDEALADSLIETYLEPFEDMRIGGQAARRTLRALFVSGHNVSSAAAALRVDRSTVHRQRNELERRLGYRLKERQSEIELALRIEELRSAAVS